MCKTNSDKHDTSWNHVWLVYIHLLQCAMYVAQHVCVFLCSALRWSTHVCLPVRQQLAVRQHLFEGNAQQIQLLQQSREPFKWGYILLAASGFWTQISFQRVEAVISVNVKAGLQLLMLIWTVNKLHKRPWTMCNKYNKMTDLFLNRLLGRSIWF